MILPRRRVIGVFVALAFTIQMGYYFEFFSLSIPPDADLYDFHASPFHSIPDFTSNHSSTSHLFTALHTLCNKTKWHPDVYINCSSITLPAFEAVNQLQTCIRWAVDAGVGLVKPTFVTSKNITGNLPVRSEIDFLLDETFLWQTLAENCPLLKVVETREFSSDFVELEGDPFFPGKLYRKGSYNRYVQVRLNREQRSNGTHVVIREEGSFCGWERRRDPLPLQLAFKNLFRFNRSLATISTRILPNLPVSFFGVHLMAENEYPAQEDFVEELLDAVLRANTSAHPVVYVACADAHTLTQFVQRAHERGVNATHKWAAAQRVDTNWMTKSLTLDQMKVVDHLVMQRALYIFGSAKSIDAFMLGMDRHVLQFGNLEYHGVDSQQYLFGSGVNLWDGNSW